MIVQDNASLTAARGYLARGWAPIPVPRRHKRPAIKGWQKLRPQDADLATYFADEPNLGILLGESSGALIDIDLDCPEALALADALLPNTAAIFGRPGNPRSHRLYVVESLPATRKFEAPDGKMLVELRSTGCQTIFPPSLHHSGEQYAWHSQGEPSELNGEQLLAAVARLAAAALLVRAWPAERGRRQDLALARAGALERRR